jgi:GT2 family glycosyltransferase
MLEKFAIVVVTYKRQKLLATLLESLLQLEIKPSDIVVVDNENSTDTSDIIKGFASKTSSKVHYVPMQENTGGSGGFSKGVEVAYDLGTEWFWLMDDDVAVLPDAINKLQKWMPKFKVIQGQRFDFDNTAFYWQYRFIPSLGIPNPIANSKWDSRRYKPMNTACFEGGLFHRDVVSRVGLPDNRFFIYWDDTIYGYLASRAEKCVIVEDFIMRRTREMKQMDMGVRHLNGTSDMVRYYIMRNRAYMAKYFMLHGNYNPIAYSLGTLLTLAKELIRITTVDKNFKTGVAALVSGLKAGRAIHKDKSWEPMPRLVGQAESDLSGSAGGNAVDPVNAPANAHSADSRLEG